MGGGYDAKLAALRSAIAVAKGDPFSIEAEVAALVAEGGPRLGADLLLSLSDEADAGAMYALVHAAEALDTRPFAGHVTTVLAILPDLAARAPNWTLTLVRRMMGGEATLGELVRQLSAAPEATRAAARTLCKANAAIAPDSMPQAAKAAVALAAG